MENEVNTEKSTKQVQHQEEVVYDTSKDVTLCDEQGDRIASMREYVFLHLATSAN